MKDFVLIVVDLAVTAAKLLGPGGVRAIVAENVPAQAATARFASSTAARAESNGDGAFPVRLGALLLRPGRIRKIAIGLQPSTLLKFHEAPARNRCPSSALGLSV